jgi:hypothetical protein
MVVGILIISLCGGVCAEMNRMLNCYKESSKFYQIVHYVLSDNVVCVVVNGFMTKRYIGHDLLKLKKVRSESFNS